MYCCYTSNQHLLNKVVVEPQKVSSMQELKNSESEDDSTFYLFSMFFEFAVYNTFTHLFNML
jgi:hypothetical protein